MRPPINLLFTSAAGVIALVLSSQAWSADAKSIVEKCAAKDIERKQGVQNYVVEQSMMGHTVAQYFERVTIETADGTRQETFRIVPTPVVQQRIAGNPGSLSPQDAELYARSLEDAGEGLSNEMDKGMEAAGLPKGMLGSMGSPDEPWASPDPQVMMGSMGGFMRSAGKAQSEVGDGKSEATEEIEGMADFADKAKLVGTEKVGKIKAWHLRAEGINQTHSEDGQEFTMNTVSVWVDKKKCVPLRMKMEGEITSEGQTRPFYIERISSDYRNVPDSKMYESYHQVMRMGGMLDAAQQKEMAEAKTQLAEFDKQMATMDPGQRAMMENMMGGQIKMMRNMVDGGAFETETIVRSIRVNTGVQGATVYAVGAPPSQATSKKAASKKTATSESGGSLAQMVQRDLVTLGYNPGNTDGEVTTATIVAISKFQAENGLEVTGAVTPQLAGILSAKASAGQQPAAAAPPMYQGTSQANLQAAQQACLEQKMEEAKKSQKKKRGFGSLMSAVSKTANLLGKNAFVHDMSKTTQDIYDVNSTAQDYATAAKELGITEEDVAECQNPQ